MIKASKAIDFSIKQSIFLQSNQQSKSSNNIYQSSNEICLSGNHYFRQTINKYFKAIKLANQAIRF